MQTILNFLTDLSQNNNREWFDKNRKTYEETKEKFLAFTELLNHEIRQFDPSIPIMDPKKCMFRIFRDVRFSNDKRPYKSNYGSFLSSGGRKSPLAGYYIHLEPGSSFIGGGIYMPQSDALKSIRDAIFQAPEELLDIMNAADFKKHFGELWGDQLKTAPRGFPKDWKHIELLRFKSFVGSKSLSNADLTSPNFMHETIETFKALYPLNRYMNDVLESKYES